MITQFANALYFIDGKFFTSFRDLILRPGTLSLAFIDGQRNRYISPISMFLLINLVFFSFNPATAFNMSLVDQVTLQPHSKMALDLVKRSMAEMDLTFEEYKELYKVQSTSLSKTIIILNIPIFAFLIYLFNIRKRKYYYVDHFIFATHTLSIILTILPFSFLWEICFSL